MKRQLVMAFGVAGLCGVLGGCDTIHTQNATVPRADDPNAYRPVPMPKPMPPSEDPGMQAMPAGGAGQSQPQTAPTGAGGG